MTMTMNITFNINNIDVIKYDEHINTEFIKDRINNVYIKNTTPLCDVCTICLEDFEYNSNVIKINCGHIFHPNCIYKWLKPDKINTCPTCRQNIIY